MSVKARKASLVLHEKLILANGGILELVIWRLPEATPERPHGLKYRLYFGRGGKCLVRYDNETGEGDHRHVKGREMSYAFVSVEKLLHAFEADVRRYGNGDEKKD